MKKKKRKARVKLDHEAKRQVAKQVVAGRFTKQIAAEWNVSEDYVRKIAADYTVTFKHEKFPDAQ